MFAATLLLAACLQPPQEGQHLAGRVLDLDGRPVAGAEVVLLHRPLPCVADPATEVRVVVAADAAGRFRAAVAPHLAFSVHARWPGAASVVEEGVEAGAFCELRQDPLALPLHVQLEGLGPWSGRGPFRLQFAVGSEHLDLLAVPVRDGAADVPALPAMPSRTAELVDAGGEVLWAVACDGNDAEVTLAVPAPQPLRLEVVDGAGAPVPGAEVRRHLLNHWYTASAALPPMDRFRCLWPLLGRTDDHGRLEVQDVRAEAAGYLWLLARKVGCVGSLGGVQRGRPFRDGRLDEEAPPDAGGAIRFTLTAPPPVAQALPLGAGLPPPEGPLAVRWRVELKGRGGDFGLPFVELLPPVADGRLALALPMPPGAHIEGAWLLLPDAVREQLQRQTGVLPPRTLRARRPDQLLQPGKVPLAPDELQGIAVIGADGRPAERTVVFATIAAQRADGNQIWLRTDRLGCALVPRGARVSVLGAAGWATLELPAPAGPRVRVELAPLRVRTLRVVDDGKPVAGAAVRVLGFDTDANEGGAGELHPRDLQLLVDVLPTLHTDRDGRVRLAVPPAPGGLTLQVHAGPRMAAAGGQQRLALGKDEPDDEVRLEIGAGAGR